MAADETDAEIIVIPARPRNPPTRRLAALLLCLSCVVSSGFAQPAPQYPLPTFGGVIQINPAPALNTTYAAGGLVNGILTSGGGNFISYCPVLSCVTLPTTDHQRASALFWSTTSDDGHSEEQTVAIETIIGTGYAKPWTVNTHYNVGDNVKFQDTRNAVYRVVTAGTSASTGTGPTGTGTAITDGSVVWSWVNAAAIDGKVGLYNETSVLPGAGNTWAQANNVQLSAGVVPTFNINTEMDFTNNAADCPTAGGNCNSLEMNMGGNFRSTAGIHLSSTASGSVHGAQFGIRLNSPNLASDADIEVESSAAIGMQFITGTHSSATYVDSTASAVSFNISGAKTFEMFNDTSTTPAAFNLGGTYSLAAITTQNATTPVALTTKDLQKICFNNSDACFIHSVPLGKIYYQVGGVSLFSVADTTGNAIFKGSVTPSGTP